MQDHSSRPLGRCTVGQSGTIVHVGAPHAMAEAGNINELERRLLELGFVEGAAVEVLQEGLFGRDPILVRVNDTRIALRRREAAYVRVEVGQNA